MSSLWSRASPRERAALRIVAGAVINARDAHPNAAVDRKFARSVAKRAIGTLSSQFEDVLAASNRRPSSAEREITGNALRRRSNLFKICKRGPAKGFYRWPPLARAVKSIAWEVSLAKRAGNAPRAEAMIDCLRIIAKMVARENSEGLT